MRRIGKIIDGEYYGPTRIPMSMGGKAHAWAHRDYEEKSFSDVLGPIDGYLRSAVGRPWNDVYSELSANLGKFSWPLRHILAVHINVETNTYRGADGKVWACNKYGVEKLTPGWSRPQFYVEPESGILQVVTARRRWPEQRSANNNFLLSDGRSAVLIDKIWYIGNYEFVPDPVDSGGFKTSVYGLGTKYEQRFTRYRESGPVKIEAVWPDYRFGHGRMMFRKQKQANKKELREVRRLYGKKSAV